MAIQGVLGADYADPGATFGQSVQEKRQFGRRRGL